MSVVALNTLDAGFTAFFLSHGGQEMNPLMDLLLHSGCTLFIAGKSLVIALCILVLSITKNFKVARIGLATVILIYAAVLGWHLYLLRWLGI